MNQFNKKLDKAQSQHRRNYIISGLVMIGILFLIVVIFIFSRGTRVEVMPPEAGKSATIRVTNGFSFSIGNVVYSLAGKPIINVSAPGFKDRIETIDSIFLGKIYPLEMLELPGRLIINITGEEENLSKTNWKINGRDVAFAANLDLELEAGTYTVMIDNPFFQPKELTVEIERRKQTKLQTDMEPVNGMLNISSNPAGAKIFLNGSMIGETPLKYRQKGGTYSLRITADNYVDTTEHFEITYSEPKVTRSYQLEPIKAKIIPELIPKGGKLLVNGTLAKGPIFISINEEHQLTYMKSGYYPETKIIRLTTDQDRKILFQLKPEIGKIEISSSPNATIWINNKNYGNKNITVNLPAITHQVSFKKPGYRTVTKTIKPTAKFVQKVSAKLLTEYQARLKEAPGEYKNKAGVKLKLFIKPGYLIMGAPRSEKGQRANEFQKKVRLTKSFYAGIFEITNDQFAKFNPKKVLGVANAPVVSVSWNEAAVFCNWLSDKERLRHFYKIANGKVNGFNENSDGYRLLSEAEWEWLSRKAGKTEQTIFSWGNEMIIPPKIANIADETSKGKVKFYVPNYNDGYDDVAPVGSFNRELSGLYDMAGNVSEWVHDIYTIMPPIENKIVENPLGKQHGQSHVIKGANFRSGTITMLRPAFREGLITGRDDVGFRIGRYLYGGVNE